MIRTLTLKNYSTYSSLEASPLGSLNILIGANGSGKSNLLKALDLMGRLHARRPLPDLSPMLPKGGRALLATDSFQSELTYILDGPPKKSIAPGSTFPDHAFHDFDSANIPSDSYIVDTDDCPRLADDFSNLWQVLGKLMEAHPGPLKEIEDCVSVGVLGFGGFFKMDNRLMWRREGESTALPIEVLSPATVRFIAMATALLQPNLPELVLLDNPDLGLHHRAIPILAEVLESVSKTIQIIATTQNPLLLDQMEMEDIVVVRLKDGASSLERLRFRDYDIWLEHYSMGDLWMKNVIRS